MLSTARMRRGCGEMPVGCRGRQDSKVLWGQDVCRNSVKDECFLWCYMPDALGAPQQQQRRQYGESVRRHATSLGPFWVHPRSWYLTAHSPRNGQHQAPRDCVVGPHTPKVPVRRCRGPGAVPMGSAPHGNHTGVSPCPRRCLTGPNRRARGLVWRCNSCDVSNLHGCMLQRSARVAPQRAATGYARNRLPG